jgi:hypothetical protein
MLNRNGPIFNCKVKNLYQPPEPEISDSQHQASNRLNLEP